MSVDPVGFSKLKFQYTDGEGSIYPGMEAKIEGSPTNAQLQTFVDAAGGFWQDRLEALTNPNWTLSKLRLIYSDGTIERLLEGTVAVVGTLANVTQSTRSSCIVTGYSISSFYRGGKPRTYWPYPGRYESASDTHWNASFAGDMAAAVQLLINDLNGYTATGITSVTAGCIRRRRLNAPVVPPEFFPYLSVHGDSRICTQRRRLGRL